MVHQKVQLVLFFLFLSYVVASVDYSSQIQPIFDDRCVSCHGSMGGLNLTSYENLMDGGLSGDEVIPYDHVSSELWIRVNSGADVHGKWRNRKSQSPCPESPKY